MTDWITDRLPTEADADEDGDVYVCTSPQLNKELFDFENWQDVTLGWPWRHTSLWTPPTPAPEPTPAAPEPERATRGFARIIWHPENQVQIAIATDGTAWRRFVVCGDWENWEQVTPLPQPGEE